MTLGEAIKAARIAAGMSLRDVERATDGGISNGYLSLLESGKVKEPSPYHLHSLAQALKLDYAELIRLAGYAVPGESSGGSARVHGIALSGGEDLTPAERRVVEEFIELVRSNRPASQKPTKRRPRSGVGQRRRGMEAMTLAIGLSISLSSACVGWIFGLFAGAKSAWDRAKPCYEKHTERVYSHSLALIGASIQAATQCECRGEAITSPRTTQ